MKKLFTRMLLLLLACATVMPAFSASLSLPASQEPTPANVKDAVAAFKSLPAKEKRERFKAVKKVIKQFKADKKAGKEPLASTAVQVIVAILLPPLGIYLHEGEINSRFWIGLVLWLLFYIPGLIYALVVILGNAPKA